MASNPSDPRIRLTRQALEFQSSAKPAVTLTADTGTPNSSPYTLTLPSGLGFAAGRRVLASDAGGLLAFLDLTDPVLQSGSAGSQLIGTTDVRLDGSGHVVAMDDGGLSATLLDDASGGAVYAFEGGATDIVDDGRVVSSGGGTEDTVANAFAKVDAWLVGHLVGQPPAPTFWGCASSAGGFTVAWLAPPQVPAAFAPGLYLPAMTALEVTLEGGGLSTPLTYTLTQGALMPRGDTPLRAVTFTTNSGWRFADAAPTGTTPFSGVGVGGASVVADLYTATQTVVGLAAAAGPFTVRVAYRNSSGGQPRPLLLTNVRKAAGRAPGKASLAQADPSGSGLAARATPPAQYVEGEANSGTTPAIAAYRFTFDSAPATASGADPYAPFNASGAAQPPPRRYSPGSPTDASGASTFATASALVPVGLYDLPLALTVAASNTSAPALFGASSGPPPLFRRTALPSPSPTQMSAGALTFQRAGLTYPLQGVPFATRKAAFVPVDVYDLSAVAAAGGVATASMGPFALVSDLRPGLRSAQAGAFAARFRLDASGATHVGPTGCVVTYAGLDGALTNAEDASGALVVTGEGDPFTAAGAGFYRLCSLAVTLKAVALRAGVPTSAWLYHDLSGGATTVRHNASTPLHFDEFQAQPILGRFEVTDVSGSSALVCGVRTWTAPLTLHCLATVANAGNYYVPAVLARATLQWGGATLGGGATVPASAPLYDPDTLVEVTSTGPLGGRRRALLFEVALPEGNTSVFTGGTEGPLRVALTVASLAGEASGPLASTVEGAVPYLDLPSLATKALHTRVQSGLGPSPSSFGASYDQAALLTQTPYTAELQLANGLYQTKGCARGGYLDYGAFSGLAGAPDYAADVSSVGTRYVTLAFAQPQRAGGGTYNYATLTLSAAGGGTDFGEDWGTDPTTGALRGVTMQVRVVPTDGVGGTGWLDANARVEGRNVNAATLPEGFPVLNGQRAPSASVRPLVVPATTGASAFTFYVRVGLDMAKALCLRDVSVAFSET